MKGERHHIDSSQVATSRMEPEEEVAVEAVEIDKPRTSGGRVDRYKSVPLVLSDAGRYSYCGICALSLHILFPDQSDLKFCKQHLKMLVKHLRLPNSVEKVMVLLMQSLDGNIDSLISTLRKEPALQHNCLLVLQDLVFFAVQGGVYDARMRVLIKHIACLLRADLALVELYEESVVDFLTDEAHELTEEEKKEIEKKKFNKKFKRYMMVGLATLGGGAVIGLTGGLAAPLVAAGAGAIIGGAGAAVLGSAAGIAIIGSLFGVAGAGLTGYKMNKRVGAVQEFAFDFLTEGNQLHITIAISGWLSSDSPNAFQKPWKMLFNSREQYCLRYESKFLVELGETMDYLYSFAASMAAQEALKYTIFSGLLSAIMWPASIVSLAGVIDNPWGVCCRRSAEVGKQLADVLLSRHQGRRPVTLIGFSLGARVIYYCLQEMSKRKDCEGIVEDVIILGAPVAASVKNWEKFSRVVSGRIVNGYCKRDWLLRFVYRTSSITYNIAGLQPIKWDNRKMFNIDLSDVVEGHMDYANKMDRILKAVGVRTREDMFDIDSKLRKSKTLDRMSDPCRKDLRKWKSDTEISSYQTLEEYREEGNSGGWQRSQSFDSISTASQSSQVTHGMIERFKKFTNLRSYQLQISGHRSKHSSKDNLLITSGDSLNNVDCDDDR